MGSLCACVESEDRKKGALKPPAQGQSQSVKKRLEVDNTRTTVQYEHGDVGFDSANSNRGINFEGADEERERTADPLPAAANGEGKGAASGGKGGGKKPKNKKKWSKNPEGGSGKQGGGGAAGKGGKK